ncbi:Armadillo-like helical [Cynara cardunculus var. scolymus]|uniref:Armadillo-like helical n=1 Tax=Cynara cardunculus var. scolymus TaxID=59895 RepID=A0A103XYZ7_CYNCS|nr:Armadillo-like helical [Cynara cardunculus var. scolymus]
MLDSDDTDSVSSSSTIRGSTREKALVAIIEAFNSSLPHEFVEKKFATMLHQYLNSIKKGSAKEVALASHAVGLLALTAGSGKKAQEILEEAVSPISEALKSRSDSSKIASLLDCLAVITFVGGNEPEETDKCMQIMWQVVHPKLGPNVVVTKPSPPIITAMVVSAWSFLLTTMDGWTLDPKSWQGSVRIAAGEALALIFEIGNLEKFYSISKGSNDSSINEGNNSQDVTHIQGLRAKILNQDGYSPETSVKIGGESLTTTTWCQLIQLNFLKRFLRGGFIKHMQENEFLHEVFDFAPKKKLLSGADRVSGTEKRMYKSPNSALNKARTRYLNKQRMLAQDKNAGHYALGFDEE